MTHEQEYQKAYHVKYRAKYYVDLKAKKAIYYQNNKNRIKSKTKANYLLNKEKAKQYNIKYRIKNKEILKDKKKIYCQDNRIILEAKRLIYVKNNKERLRQKYRENHIKNRQRNCERVRRYRKDHLEATKATAKRYLKTPRGKAGKTEVSNNRRIQMITDPLQRKLIKQWLVEIYSKPTFKCYWCENIFPINMFSKDHVIALKLGGKHELENVCASCKPCNREKWAMSVEAWVAKINLEREQLRLAI